MDPYYNRCTLQGRIVSAPRMKDLSSSTKLTSFQLSMEESWISGGQRRSRHNRITVEVVGRDARKVVDEARVGLWVTLEGYLRSEEYRGRTLIKVRTLNIMLWEHTDAEETVRASGDSARPDGAKASKGTRPPVENPFTRD